MLGEEPSTRGVSMFEIVESKIIFSFNIVYYIFNQVDKVDNNYHAFLM